MEAVAVIGAFGSRSTVLLENNSYSHSNGTIDKSFFFVLSELDSDKYLGYIQYERSRQMSSRFVLTTLTSTYFIIKVSETDCTVAQSCGTCYVDLKEHQ